MTPEAIVDSAVRQGLTVIAMTDYNSNLNAQRAINYARNAYLGTILALSGVEVTIAHGHLLAYFEPDCLAGLTKFLSRLDLTGAIGVENT
jgi:predicted metal-dependent phosphoesterase TrpH